MCHGTTSYTTLYQQHHNIRVKYDLTGNGDEILASHDESQGDDDENTIVLVAIPLQEVG